MTNQSIGFEYGLQGATNTMHNLDEASTVSVLYLSICIALLAAWAFQKRSQCV